MCGIVGMAGNLFAPHNKMFRDMLIFDTVRGQDSTGVLRVPLGLNADVDIYKDVGLPDTLWNDYALDPTAFDYRGVIKGSSKLLLGHNRAATVGVVNVSNAHPFSFGKVHGVHNGSLWSTSQLDGNFDVDSKDLYYTINNKGIDHAWENMQGAAALVWWDENTNNMHMIRNKERPLYTARSNDDAVLFWASEAWMIQVAANRNKVQLKKGDTGAVLPPVMLPENVLHTFEVYATSAKLLETRELKKYVFPTNSYGTHTQQGWTRGSQGGTTTTNTTAGSVLSSKRLPQINAHWAKGLKKADKEIRGKKALLRRCTKVYDSASKSWEYTIVGEMIEDKSPVLIFPETVADFNKWDVIKKSAGNGLVEISLKARPRYAFDTVKDEMTYSVSSKNVRLLKITHTNTSSVSRLVEKDLPAVDEVVAPVPNLFQGPGGGWILQKEFEQFVDQSGGACAHCDDVPDVAGYSALEWLDKDCFVCGTCADNPYVMSLAKGYN